MAFDGMLFRNNATPALTKWGNTGKLSDLTAEEIDNNFYALLARLKVIEDNPPQAASISNIIVNGSQLSIQLSNGSSFGPFTLPIATFELQGEVANGVTYHELDIVTVAHEGVYLVRLDHAAVLPFDENRMVSGNKIYLKVFGFDAEIYDIGFFYPGRPGIGIDDGAAIAGHLPDRPITLPIGLAGSVARLSTACAAAMTFPLKKGVTDIGSVDFALGAVAGTFTFAAAVTFNGTTEVLRVMKPTGGIDASARELLLTLKALQVLS